MVPKFLIACLPLARATTEWALSDDATVLFSSDIYTQWCPDRHVVTAQAFKSEYAAYGAFLPFSPDEDREIKLDLGSSRTVTSCHVSNSGHTWNSVSTSERLGSSAIYTTDDDSHNSISQYTKCS